MRSTPFILLAALAACGAPGVASDGGHTACVAIDSTDFCSAEVPCCQNGYCDPASNFCRSSESCGADGQGCDDTHPCCSNLLCSGNQCVLQSNPTGTTTSGTGGNCQGVSQPCGTNQDCCFGLCAPNGLCASPGGNTTSGNTSTTGTNGGTCLNAGAGCSSGTDCCSRRCTNNICG